MIVLFGILAELLVSWLFLLFMHAFQHLLEEVHEVRVGCNCDSLFIIFITQLFHEEWLSELDVEACVKGSCHACIFESTLPSFHNWEHFFQVLLFLLFKCVPDFLCHTFDKGHKFASNYVCHILLNLDKLLEAKPFSLINASLEELCNSCDGSWMSLRCLY